MYTCYSNGKKLIWDKGVIVKSPSIPNPTPSAKPSLSPSQTSTLAPISTVTPSTSISPSNSPTPTSQSSASPTPITSPSTIYIPQYQVSYSIYKEALDKLKLVRYSTPKVDAIYGPNVDKAKAFALLASFQDALTFYSLNLGRFADITIVFIGSEDKDWYMAKVRELEGPSAIAGMFSSNHCVTDEFHQCGYGTNSDINRPVFYEFIGKSWNPDNASRISPNHEAVHMWQISLFGNLLYAKLPAWFIEGQASFLGNVTASRFEDTSKYRFQSIEDLRKFYPNYSSLNVADWNKELDRLFKDIDYTFNNQLGYSAGAILYEYLFTTLPLSSNISFLKAQSEGLSWDDAAVKCFGISGSELRTRMSEYLVTTLRQGGF